MSTPGLAPQPPLGPVSGPLRLAAETGLCSLRPEPRAFPASHLPGPPAPVWEPPSTLTERCLTRDGGASATPPATHPIPRVSYRSTPRSGPRLPHPHPPARASRAPCKAAGLPATAPEKGSTSGSLGRPRPWRLRGEGLFLTFGSPSSTDAASCFVLLSLCRPLKRTLEVTTQSTGRVPHLQLLSQSPLQSALVPGRGIHRSQGLKTSWGPCAACPHAYSRNRLA